jgi:hypothetical protein
VKKRASSAGRKPRGEYQGKTMTLTTRITPATRYAIERAAAKSGRSLSQEVEHGLARYVAMLKPNRDRGSHIRALGEAVMLVAQCIERATEKHWNDDAFAGEALRRGCEFLVSHFAPRGALVTPASIQEAAARRPSEAGVTYRDAAGIGESEAGQVISWIESWNFRTMQEIQRTNQIIPGHHFPDEWYAHEQLFRALKSRAQATQKHR